MINESAQNNPRVLFMANNPMEIAYAHSVGVHIPLSKYYLARPTGYSPLKGEPPPPPGPGALPAGAAAAAGLPGRALRRRACASSARWAGRRPPTPCPSHLPRPLPAGKLLLPDERNMLAVDENPYESKVVGELDALKVPHVRLKRGE
jgi:hypothetical protein